LYSLVLYSFFVLTVLHFAFSLRTTRNTNTHVPGGIRSCNPSNRSAADSPPTLLGHWHRRDSILRPASP
jgi:hypothetical protein